MEENNTVVVFYPWNLSIHRHFYHGVNNISVCSPMKKPLIDRLPRTQCQLHWLTHALTAIFAVQSIMCLLCTNEKTL